MSSNNLNTILIWLFDQAIEIEITQDEMSQGNLFYTGLLGSWVNRTLKRFLIITRCRENLSSGEKRAMSKALTHSGRIKSIWCYLDVQIL